MSLSLLRICQHSRSFLSGFIIGSGGTRWLIWYNDHLDVKGSLSLIADLPIRLPCPPVTLIPGRVHPARRFVSVAIAVKVGLSAGDIFIGATKKKVLQETPRLPQVAPVDISVDVRTPCEAEPNRPNEETDFSCLCFLTSAHKKLYC